MDHVNVLPIQKILNICKRDSRRAKNNNNKIIKSYIHLL